MKPSRMWKGIQISIIVASMTVQAFPIIAWAQLNDVDPALDAAVTALIANDPEIAKNPELAQLCRQVAEATVVDPRERAAVTSEVAAIHREGVDLATIIPTEVREAAREEFTKVQGQMKEQLETLRATDPERAKEVELMMREGERQMASFESGEHYVPSPELVEHAQGMFKEWESDMLSQGAPPELVERARMEFTMWSGGEMGGMMGGPGAEMGPGHELGGPGPGGMPSTEQMQAMVDAGQMTPEQLQMAKDYMQQGGSENVGPHEGFGPGPAEAYMPEGWARDQTGEFHYVDTGGTTPEQYHEQMEQQYREVYQPENQNYDNVQQRQFDTSQPPPAEYKIREDAHVADHNGDFIPETHMHEIFRHTEGTGDLTDDTCHDHATGGTVSC